MTRVSLRVGRPVMPAVPSSWSSRQEATLKVKKWNCNFSSYSKIHQKYRSYPHDRVLTMVFSLTKLWAFLPPYKIWLSVTALLTLSAVIMWGWGFPGPCPPAPSWCALLSQPVYTSALAVVSFSWLFHVTQLINPLTLRDRCFSLTGLCHSSHIP